jgi:hypothetical protein
LRDWFRVLHVILTGMELQANEARGGHISALHVQRCLQISSYHQAWSLCVRLRNGLQSEEFRRLMGVTIAPDSGNGDEANGSVVGKYRSAPVQAFTGTGRHIHPDNATIGTALH